MYPSEKVYRSLIYFASGIMPSGVSITDGESYGVRLEDPTGMNPAVTVTLPDAQIPDDTIVSIVGLP